MFKYQEQFAVELAESWLNGNHEYVRTTIRNLKNKAQSAYIAASVAVNLQSLVNITQEEFISFIHPNNK